MKTIPPKLDTARLKGVARKEALRGIKLSNHRGEGWSKPWIHMTTGAKLYNVGNDTIIVSDGGSGYIPFSLSGLRALLDEVEASPVVTEVLL